MTDAREAALAVIGHLLGNEKIEKPEDILDAFDRVGLEVVHKDSLSETHREARAPQIGPAIG